MKLPSEIYKFGSGKIHFSESLLQDIKKSELALIERAEKAEIRANELIPILGDERRKSDKELLEKSEQIFRLVVDLEGVVNERDKYEKERDEMRQLLAIEEEKAESRMLLIKALKDSSPKWIPVSEKLPEECGWYLCCFEEIENDKFQYVVWFNEGRWYDVKIEETITHWMPLPKPTTK